MPELPRISGRKAIKIFESIGFEIVRQKGSHVVFDDFAIGSGPGGGVTTIGFLPPIQQ